MITLGKTWKEFYKRKIALCAMSDSTVEECGVKLNATLDLLKWFLENLDGLMIGDAFDEYHQEMARIEAAQVKLAKGKKLVEGVAKR